MADALMTGLTKKPFESLDAGVLALLRVTLALLCADEAVGKTSADTPADTPAYEPHTVVNEAVTALPAVLACGLGKTLPTLHLLAHSNRNTQVVAGFVNGVLRTFLREREARLQAARRHPQAAHNHAPWWIERLKKDYPAQWEWLLAHNNRPPVMALRANARIHTAAQAQAHLAQHGITAHTVPSLPNALVLDKPMPVEQIPTFTQGWYSVQDLAAQHCVDLLDIHDGQRVLDACAAPGGKTAHILERANVTLTALDNDPLRLDKIRQTLQRLSRTFVGETPYAPQPMVELKTANANQVDKWWDGQPFDRIVLDAPCSASGVVRRHPDSRWLRRASDIDALVAQQAALLQSLWPTLAVGGKLLYVTCSVFKAEGEQQIAAFLKQHRDAALLPTLGHCLPVPVSVSLPKPMPKPMPVSDKDAANLSPSPNPSPSPSPKASPYAHFPNADHDGFYYALLHKQHP
jgi:16S rRNA (cytosine967-C5)-methyltransferase